jgi:hypothetical protein
MKNATTTLRNAITTRKAAEGRAFERSYLFKSDPTDENFAKMWEAMRAFHAANAAVVRVGGDSRNLAI